MTATDLVRLFADGPDSETLLPAATNLGDTLNRRGAATQ
jgi:hypothetical protein